MLKFSVVFPCSHKDRAAVYWYGRKYMILPPVFVNFFGALVVDKFKEVEKIKEGCKDLKDHLNDSRKEAKDEDKVIDSLRFPHVFRNVLKHRKLLNLVQWPGKIHGISCVSLRNASLGSCRTLSICWSGATPPRTPTSSRKAHPSTEPTRKNRSSWRDGRVQ